MPIVRIAPEATMPDNAVLPGSAVRPDPAVRSAVPVLPDTVRPDTVRPDAAARPGGPLVTDLPAPDGCVRLGLELCDPATGLDTLTRVVTTLRGRRWDVRAVQADLDAATLHLTVHTDRADLLARLLTRVPSVRSVRVCR